MRIRLTSKFCSIYGCRSATSKKQTKSRKAAEDFLVRHAKACFTDPAMSATTPSWLVARAVGNVVNKLPENIANPEHITAAIDMLKNVQL